MKKHKSRSSLKAGLPPGTLIHIGEKHDFQPYLNRIDYNSEEVKTFEDTKLRADHKSESLVSWYDFIGVQDTEKVAHTCNALGIHPLWQEDIVNTHHRPKAEVTKNQLLLTFKMIHLSEDKSKVESEQISLIFSNRWLISFQEKPGDIFNAIRLRIQTPGTSIRSRGIDYLAYRLMDTVVDNYFMVSEHFQDRINDLEDDIWLGTDKVQLMKIQIIKRELIDLRKLINPLREAIQSILKDRPEVFQEDTRMYLKDAADNVIHVVDAIEHQKEQLSSLLDSYNTSMSNRTNEVMRVLTIVATIFIPLTFIAGIYGMNFEVMPELSWNYGYLVVWIIMGITALGMLLYFKKKHWL